MADSYACNINTNPDAMGNMYFRGLWEYCPEYRTGDVVLHNGVMYLCIKPHAGHEPTDKDSADWWHKITPQTEDDAGTVTRKVLDGGFATTLANDSYEDTEPVDEVNGGTSSDKIYMPLI